MDAKRISKNGMITYRGDSSLRSVAGDGWVEMSVPRMMIIRWPIRSQACWSLSPGGRKAWR